MTRLRPGFGAAGEWLRRTSTSKSKPTAGFYPRVLRLALRSCFLFAIHASSLFGHSDFVIFLSCALTVKRAFDCIGRVKRLFLLALVILLCSCTTLVTRRDLYSPEPGPDSRERQRQLAGNITTTTNTTIETESAISPAIPPPPQFR
jgi:hypothetical protein